MTDVWREAVEAVERGLALGRACVTCSFQLEDMVVVDLLRQRQPRIPVLFLETGYHFPEVLEYRDRMAREWGLAVSSLSAERPDDRMFETDPAQCCKLRKVEPLMRGLEEYDVWFTGLRREQSPTRASLRVQETHVLPAGRGIAKISPLAAWTWRDVAAYAAVREIAALSLYEQGYASIGCAPCTSKPAPGEHARAGRWGGAKLECGIHTVTEAR